MSKIAKILTAAVIMVLFLATFNSCIITDMAGGLLLEWDDNDVFYGSGNEPRNLTIENESNEQIFVSVDVTLDAKDQPNWKDPLWNGKINRDSSAILDIDNSTNRYVWIYARTLGTEQKTGQGSHLYEGDNRDTIYVTVFKSTSTGN